MNTSLLCLAVAFTAPATDPQPPAVYSMSRPFASDSHESSTAAPYRRGLVVRGQTPGYDEEVPMPRDAGQPETFGGPSTGGPSTGGPSMPMHEDGLIVPPQTPIYQGGGDPFLQPGMPQAAPTPLYGGGSLFGVNGPQPYRMNRWVSRYDFGLLPSASTDRGLGNFSVFEFDADWEYSKPVFYNWVFSFVQEFGLRTWEGPNTSAAHPTTELPGSVYRFGWDLKLATPANNPLSALIAFNPSLNSDFQSGLTSDAWQWDGRGMIFWRPVPGWTWVGGAGYLDRVKDRVIPYAGAIYQPNDRWEWRLVFPDPRVSYFLGQPYGFSTWVYVRGEYHVEAYEVKLNRSSQREQVEIEDWRALLGLRFDNGWVTSFVEAGWVFGRDVDYRYGTPGFNVSSGFIGRMGLRF